MYPGGFDPQQPPRVKSLKQATEHVHSGAPFEMRPGASSHGVFEGAGSHFAPTQGTGWTQMVATTAMPKQSTKYEKIFPAIEVTDLTRANKALVKGSSDSLSPEPNTWRGKKYAPEGMLGASLLRLNEATTAFGSESYGSVHDAGTGLMAETLHQKWAAKSAGSKVDMGKLHADLSKKYPQLMTVEKMRGQGPEALAKQIEQSRFDAAVSAGQRALDKGLKGWQVGEHVQKKFAKHGLGPVPGGWAAALKARHSL